MKNNRRSIITTVIVLTLVLQQNAANVFCSTICSPNSCSGTDYNSCTSSSCPSNWERSASTCSVDSASGFTLIDKTADLGGSGFVITTPSSTTSCGIYAYNGNLACGDAATMTLSAGITNPFYAIQVSVWVILLDDTTWIGSDNIIMTLGSTSVSRSMSSFDKQRSECDSATQTYYRFNGDFTNYNQTSTSISISLATDNADSNCFWGLKEAVILAKLCDAQCLSCYGSLSTQCYSCVSTSYQSNYTCSSSCLAQFGTVSSSKICVHCDLKCVICSQNSTYCSSCTTSGTYQAYLYNNECTQNCPNTTFRDSSSHQCNSCPSNCDVCPSSLTCSTCATGHAWLNGSCYSTCPNGSYLINSTNCSSCDQKCILCSGSSTACSSCTLSGGNIAYLWNNTCSSACPDGTFSTSTPNLCNSCDPKCILCSGTSTTCSSCTLSGGNIAYLWNNTCYSTCPDGTYSTTAPNLCSSCDPKCILCSGTLTTCSSCTLSGGNIAYLWNNTCSSACPDGTYSTTNPNLCNSCDLKCILCSGSSTTCSSCTLSGGNIAYLWNNTCYTTCPDGTYPTSTPNVCNSCDLKCILCSGSSIFCSSCTVSGANIAYLLNNTCITNCPNGTYLTINPNICNSCDPKCITCSSSSTTCSSCTLSGANIAYLWNNTCHSTCPDGTFSTSTPNLCNSCDPKCILCSGTSTTCSSCTLSGANIAYLFNNTCITSCPNGTYLTTNPNLCDSCDPKCILCSSSSTTCSSCTLIGGSIAYLWNNTCYSTCPDGTYSTSTPNLCNSCDLKCIICSGSSTACSSCTLSGGNIAYLWNNTCITSCPDGTFYASSPNLCSTCDIKCILCSGSSTTCSSCTLNGSNMAYLWSNTCVTNCPNGTYLTANPNLCNACNTLCQLCDVSSTNCSLCSSTGYLLNLTCLAICPNPYYPDTNGGLGPNNCLQCSISCASCTNGVNSSCQSCNTGYMLSGSTCDTSCLAGYGPTLDPLVCVSCSASCKTCLNTAANCTDCFHSPTVYYLFKTGSSSTCVVSCPVSYFINATTYTCDTCPTGCYECTNNSYCYSCILTHAWVNNKCYNPCPTNYFKLNSTNCSQCSVQCKVCVNVFYNCTVCYTSGVYRSFLYNERCFTSCPAGLYGNTSSNTCKSCDPACETCFGANSWQCYVCSGAFVLSGSTCAAGCAAYYGITTDPILCVECNATCLNCSYISTNCSVCNGAGNMSAFLYDDGVTYPKCLITCPSASYSFVNNSIRLCNPCDLGCANCTNTSSNCSLCNTGYGLLNTSCLNPCPTGYFLSSSLCNKCKSPCVECEGSNATCTVCAVNGTGKKYLHNSNCVSNCPTGYYNFDNETAGPTVCILCYSTCTKCSVTQTNCSACKTNYYLYNLSSSCVSTCPTGFFADNVTKMCVNISSVGVSLAMSISMKSSLNEEVYVDLVFDYQLNQATFPLTSFQTISFDSPDVLLSMFNVNYAWTSVNSYRITLDPKTYIYLYNVTIAVLTMAQPSPTLTSSSGLKFKSSVFNQSVSQVWFLIKGPDMSALEQTIVNGLSSTSDAIRSFTTLPGVQQFNKAGLMSLLFAGAQITSSSIVMNSVHAPNFYEGARLWANCIYFQVPNWEKNGNKTKYVFSPSADQLVNKSRLLNPKRNTLETQSIFWRFQRAGFTTFFLYDCYMQILMIVLCWIMVFIGLKLESKYRWNVMPKVYIIFHKLHQITIFYLSMGLILEWVYFDSTSSLRILSFIVCLMFNTYYFIYQLYVYYDLMKYPSLQLGTEQYRTIAIKYGYFLRNIRYEEYQDSQRWSPSHWFRPYNYHILSFYKKFLMLFSLPLFYSYPQYQTGILIALQSFEVVRFCIVRPFATLRRNVIRLFLELVLLLFFVTTLLQHLLVTKISKNNQNLIANQTLQFYVVGWIGFIAIFVFNISFFIMLIVDIVLSLRKSSRQNMREIRKDYYYNKIAKYQQSYNTHVDMETLDSWVVKGDLNEKWIDDEKMVDMINITTEKYTITKMGDGFTVQVEKITLLQMKSLKLGGAKRKMKVKQQMTGTIGLTRAISLNFNTIVQDIFSEYDVNYTCDYLVIKTISEIDLTRYETGETINVRDQPAIQTITLVYPDNSKDSHRLKTPMKGFPLNSELLRPIIGNSQQK